jgi:formate hydrogenlyase transcriptional activator
LLDSALRITLNLRIRYMMPEKARSGTDSPRSARKQSGCLGWKTIQRLRPLSEDELSVNGGKEIESTDLLFQRLFDSSPDAIVVTDAAGHIRRANPQSERLFGYSSGEIIGSAVEVLLPERFRQAHPQHREAYYSDSHIRPMGTGLELYARRKDGSEFPVDIMLSPVEIEGGRLILTVVRDISERKRVEEALRESEERFRLLVDGARDYAIFMLDPGGKIVTWNPGAQRLKGYSAEEIAGRYFSLFYPQEDVERKKPAHELAVAAREGRCEDEGWRIRKDGSRFWANVIITALRKPDGSLIGFSKVTRDLTNRRKAEEALLLELSNAVLSSLDIRQMLNAIAASIQHLVPNDYATIALYDKNTDQLRVQELKPGPPREIVLSIDGSPAGWAFRNRQPLFMNQLETERFAPESLAHHIRAGIRSGCWLPLNSHGQVIGTLFIGSRMESAFDPGNVEMLLQMAGQIAVAIDNVYAFRQISELSDKLKEEKRYLEEEIRTEYSFEEIVGESSSLKRVLKQVETVAPTDATVLILGETGTGKELIARAIHNLSPRREHTFVKLNCSAIPLGLLESELFGHEKGAFTGAIAQRIGRLELAHMGTLFLDEIGDLPLELQPKILRALQEKEIERLGGKRTISVDVRLIAATNRDLAQMVKEGQFRSDLYYRLKVFPVTIPPLRQRREDVPLLVNYFVTKHARRMNKTITDIPAETMAAFSKWSWPGNVRELENFLERAVILTQGTSLRAPLAELEMPEAANSDGDLNMKTAEREHILRALREAQGMIGGPGGAAEKLGLKRTTLNSKLKKLGIQRGDYS